MADTRNVAVSVIMSVYNGERYLQEAVESILMQTFTDFEFIIIDDGSTDRTSAILGRIKDRRVKIISQSNQGLVASLNTAIGLAKAPLIARMDADDLSLPKRLEEQVSLLADSPDCVIVGSNLIFIDGGGSELYRSPMLLHDPEMKLELLIRNPFAHGSVMYRAEAVKQAGLYDKSTWPAEDSDLWSRLGRLGAFANVNEVLYLYRVNDQGISSASSDLQAKRYREVLDRLWSADSLPNIPSYAKVAALYHHDAQTTRQQLSRLAGVYWGVARVAVRRRRLGFALRAAGSVLSSGTGLVTSAKFMGRKLLGR